MLPSEYYEGTVLKEHIFQPCKALDSENTTCFDSLYPPLPVASRAEFIEHGFIMKEQNKSGIIQVEKVNKFDQKI